MDSKLTTTLQRYFGQAHSLAVERDHIALEPAHVIVAMARDASGVLASIAKGAGIEYAVLRNRLEGLLEGVAVRTSPEDEGDVQASRELARTLNVAQKAAGKAGDSHIGTDTYLLACARKNDAVRSALEELGLTADKLEQACAAYRSGSTISGENDEENRDALAKYTSDLTAAAAADKLDPVIGRDDEIRRTMQILQRRTKNNPVLIGDPGVGKTAIVEGLAQRIVAGEVPANLKGRRVLALDLAGLLAGAKYRGEFEERLKEVLAQLTKDSEKYIVFIDELHTLVGAGASEGAIDAANMLKPMLARGELRCIGATTLDEYRKRIEKDAALERRFQRLLVDEPDVPATVAILRGLRDRYEIHHGIRISDPAIVAAAELSARYVTDRKLPDKAIDLVDEAAARLRIEADSKPEELDQLDRSLALLGMEHAALKREDDSASRQRLAELDRELAEGRERRTELEARWQAESALRAEETRIKEEREALRAELDRLTSAANHEAAAEIKYGKLPELDAREAELAKRRGERLLNTEVGEEEIAAVVARATGIPVSRLLGSERARLLGMADKLRGRVLDQDEAVAAVAAAVLRSRTGIADPSRPIGSFLLLGPTGVGKTELAKATAEFLFGSERQMVRVDMSEYGEKHTVARLIGAPPGYVGYEEGGQLTEIVRRRPYSVILLDEIEKAHPDVFNILLQVLDEGRLTDGHGRTVDFRNTVLAMTSNLGSAALAGPVDAAARAAVMAEVRSCFKPEFLNRLDEIIIFNGLGERVIRRIAKLQLDRLIARLAKSKYHIDYEPEVVERLAEAGFDPRYGARPLKRALQALVETPLAEAVLAGKWDEGRAIRLAVAADGGLRFDFPATN